MCIDIYIYIKKKKNEMRERYTSYKRCHKAIREDNSQQQTHKK